MQLAPEKWPKLSRLLDQALDLAPENRLEWLSNLGAEDAELRDTLREILHAGPAVETSSFLNALPTFSDLPAVLRTQAGDTVGAYRLIRELGIGGTATVWLAERADGEIQRRVALKLPHVGAADRDLGLRLRRERDILASLEHPNIARLYDVGVDQQGRPYMALEYVEGAPLDEFCRRRKLTIHEELALFLRIARVVAFAHGRLVVHRDLKPSNILVDDEGEVHLLDFGIARLLDDRAHARAGNPTQIGQRVFTPVYAAPEQIDAGPVSVVTDVYSLGVVLFELLTGRLPYAPERQTAAALEESILRDAAPRASRWAPSARASMLRGDLDTILDKALRKQPEERYSSVEAFAADIERFLARQPIAARHGSRAYRAQLFVRRHAPAVTTVAAGSLALVAALTLAALQWRDALQQRAIAEDRLREAYAATTFSTAVMTEALRGEESITPAELLARSAALARTVGGNDIRTRIVATNFAANWYAAHGMAAEAEKLLAQALADLPPSVGPLRVTLECNRASALFRLRENAQAQSILSKVLPRTDVDDALIEPCFALHSSIARARNDAVVAVRDAQEALRRAQRSGGQTSEDRAAHLANVGAALTIGESPARAEAYFEAAIGELQAAALEHSTLATSVRYGWAAALLATGAPQEALEQVDAAQHRDSPAAVMTEPRLRLRAQAFLLLGQVENADRDAFQAMQQGLASANTTSEALSLALLTQVALARDDVPRAARHLDRAVELVDRSLLSEAHPALLEIDLARAALALQRHAAAEADDLASTALAATNRARCCRPQQFSAWLLRSEAALQRGLLELALQYADRASAVAAIVRNDRRGSVYLERAQAMRARVLREQRRGLGAASATSRRATRSVRFSEPAASESMERTHHVRLEARHGSTDSASSRRHSRR